MKNIRVIFVLSLLAVLMSVFGGVMAQENDLPAFKVSDVVSDEKIVLTTKNFPADTAYIVSMASSETPENFTAVAKFNSRTGGKLNVTVKIPAKFQGVKSIELKLEDDKGGVIPGNFVNIPDEAAEPAASDEVITLMNQEEQPAEEPAQEEAVKEEQPAEEPVKGEAVKEEQPAEEPVKEEAVKEEQPAEEPAQEEAVKEEQPAEEPVKEEGVKDEQPVEEPAKEEAVKDEQPAEEPAKEEAAKDELTDEKTSYYIELLNEAITDSETPESNQPLTCDFSKIPVVSITGVVRNESVTFVTADFPANSNFSVSLGYYVETWTPVREPVFERPKHEPHHRNPVPGVPAHEPITVGDETFYVLEPVDPKAPDFRKQTKPAEPKITGYVTSKFTGTEVGTFNTGDGSSQTLTFEIPASLKNVNPIAIWISDLGPCGFYSYNYFYNNSTN